MKPLTAVGILVVLTIAETAVIAGIARHREKPGASTVGIYRLNRLY